MTSLSIIQYQLFIDISGSIPVTSSPYAKEQNEEARDFEKSFIQKAKAILT